MLVSMHAREVVGLARRKGVVGASTQRIPVQLSQLLLRWCRNTRNVHLLRGVLSVPARLVTAAAERQRHDQSVKVACATSLGFYDVTGGDALDFLRSVLYAILPPDFVRAYDQIRLDAKVGGHGLRAWSLHADAAFVRQWALTVQSAQIRELDTRNDHLVLSMCVTFNLTTLTRLKWLE